MDISHDGGNSLPKLGSNGWRPDFVVVSELNSGSRAALVRDALTSARRDGGRGGAAIPRQPAERQGRNYAAVGFAIRGGAIVEGTN
jgi:hypothetical protein